MSPAEPEFWAQMGLWAWTLHLYNEASETERTPLSDPLWLWRGMSITMSRRSVSQIR